MTSRNTRDQSRAVTALCAAFGMLLGASQDLRAQSFEAHYGEHPTAEVGADVKSVNRCRGGGSIVAGTRRVPQLGSEILLTRVDNWGAPLWQYAYRFGNGINSRAEAVVELRDGSGFAVAGSILRGGTDTYMGVLRVDCAGQPMWTQVLANQGAGHRAQGFDLIESRNPIYPGNRPDIVVVGEEIIASTGQTHGRIARLTSTGGLVFSQAYSQANDLPGLRFRSVDENFSISGNYGDLVVAGSYAGQASWSFGRQALFFRTDGWGSPLCNAVLGEPDSRSNEDYHGLTSQRSASHLGESIAVGASALPLGADANSVYLTRFRAGTCVPLVQSLWHDPVDGAVAFDVVEAPRNPAGVDGAVAVAGTIAGSITSGDGLVLLADPSSLTPIWTPIRFGGQGRGSESLVAIDTLDDRFVLAGSTTTDWTGDGDPMDFYLVQTTQGMRTQCAAPWRHRWFEVRLPYARFQPAVRRLGTLGAIRVEPVAAQDWGYCCRPTP